MRCPKCGTEVDVPFASECPRCGIIFAKLGSSHPPELPGTASKPRASTSWRPWLLGGLLALALLASLLRRANAEDGWYRGVSGYDRALAEHDDTHKPLLVYFYTDWCPHCRDLDRRAFFTPEFRERFASLIKVKVNPEKGKRSKALANEFQVKGYPAVFLIEAHEPRYVPHYHDTQEFFAAIDGHYANDPIESGSSLLDRGKAAEAGEQFDRALRDNPNDFRMHYLKGIALVDQGRRVEAAFEFQNAVRIQPDAPSYDYLAWMALEKGDLGDALEYANKIIGLNPTYENGRAYGLRSEAYWRLGKNFEAYQDADRACRLGDQDSCRFKKQLDSSR